MFLDGAGLVFRVFIQLEFDLSSIPPNFNFVLVLVSVQQAPQFVIDRLASKLAFATVQPVISYCAFCYKSHLNFKVVSKSLVLWASDSFTGHFAASTSFIATTFVAHCFGFFGVALLKI